MSQKARTIRKESTDAERHLWRYLRDRRFEGEKFRRQHPVGPYVADFACSELGLIVELDGGQHAGREEYDQRRTAFLQRTGYRVLRFWNPAIFQETDGVLEMIRWAILEARRQKLDQRPLPKDGSVPSPRKRGEG